MHLNWRRGVFRCLVVLVVVGTGYAGLSWQKWSNRLEGDCWSRIAKWPDGQPFTEFDLFEQENTRANVELNKTRDAWAAESIIARNQWVASTRQKLIACETGQPVESPQGQASNVWINLRSSLLGLTIPPLAILTVIWMASGFRAQARSLSAYHRQQAAEAVAAQQPQTTETLQAPQPDGPQPEAPQEQPPSVLSPRVQATLADLGRAVTSAAPANSMVQRIVGRGRPLKA